MKRAIVTAALIVCIGASGALAGTLVTTVHGRLRPIGPAGSASGKFVARATTASLVRMRWRISLVGLGTPARRTTLTIRGLKITLRLCSPCAPNAHGELALTRKTWRFLVSKGGVVVVRTRSRPKGALRGVVRSG